MMGLHVCLLSGEACTRFFNFKVTAADVIYLYIYLFLLIYVAGLFLPECILFKYITVS